MPITIDCTDAPDNDLSKKVREGLNAYNIQHSEDINYRPLALYARDDQGELAGGLLGSTYWGWLSIDILWIREDMRGQGLGSRLLSSAEEEARRRGCRRAHVDTVDFQAPEFYLRHGYTQWGMLEDLPRGHRRHYYQKSLE